MHLFSIKKTRKKREKINSPKIFFKNKFSFFIVSLPNWRKALVYSTFFFKILCLQWFFKFIIYAHCCSIQFSWSSAAIRVKRARCYCIAVVLFYYIFFEKKEVNFELLGFILCMWVKGDLSNKFCVINKVIFTKNSSCIRKKIKHCMLPRFKSV